MRSTGWSLFVVLVAGLLAACGRTEPGVSLANGRELRQVWHVPVAVTDVVAVADTVVGLSAGASLLVFVDAASGRVRARVRLPGAVAINRSLRATTDARGRNLVAVDHGPENEVYDLNGHRIWRSASTGQFYAGGATLTLAASIASTGAVMRIDAVGGRAAVRVPVDAAVVPFGPCLAQGGPRRFAWCAHTAGQDDGARLLDLTRPRPRRLRLSPPAGDGWTAEAAAVDGDRVVVY